MTYYKKIENILGIDVRARARILYQENRISDPFKNPLIHKQINGREIVPLDVERLWGN
ncbi:hypothetical protein [Neobacillus sp. YIM B06451]|uniref:hypothetical protein n=1 Tax=Neobacillus sp. YIM B06451 TaxID=3070994 RepID=UPI00292ED2E8|nr:hypothetical protein [Neobacillus sp. YIM B06451]